MSTFKVERTCSNTRSGRAHVTHVVQQACLCQATRNIAELAVGVMRLKGFVHLSTAYVNCDLPRGSHVEERLHSFQSCCNSAGQADEVAAELAALPAEEAAARVSEYICAETKACLNCNQQINALHLKRFITYQLITTLIRIHLHGPVHHLQCCDCLKKCA